MATAAPQNSLAASLAGIGKLPMVRQVGLMVAFAATVALGVAIVLWSQTPNYRILYGSLSNQEIVDITNVLDQNGIEYKLNDMTGAVMVAADRVHEARLKLAGLGLPKGRGSGYELLDKDQGFSTSQFIESARYQRALEGELARTIASLNSIQSARVHLALPKQSAFVRARKKPSASVMVTLYQGRTLSPDQAAAIAHMVASSIPNLETENVTIVDQHGRLLSTPETAEELRYTATQFEYRRQLEEYYIKRIETILAPLVGADSVRAQVVAELDFSITEQTQESFNPDLPAIRSEQTVEENRVGAASGGVPGTLSNQPPGGGATAGEAAAEQTGSRDTSRRVVRNYELDRTVSHTRMPTGSLRRLSAAVVVDERRSVAEDGTVTTEPLSDAEMERINSLVREAIGFSAQRGDSVNVINAPFQAPPPAEPAPEPGILEQPWVWDLGKQLAGLALLVFLILGVIKPVLKNLAEKGRTQEVPVGPDGQLLLENMEGGAAALPGAEGAPQLASPNKQYEDQLAAAKSMATQEPEKVAQVVRQWVESDG